MRPIICVDFDGVLARYHHGMEGGETGTPLPGALQALEQLQTRFRVVVFTARSPKQVRVWLKRWGFPDIPVLDRKIPAFAYIDDRAITFRGDWEAALQQVVQFAPWWDSEEG